MNSWWRQLLGLGGAVLVGCAKAAPKLTGVPLDGSVRAPDHVVTLIQTLEWRLPEVPARPERDRYRLSAVLHPLAPGGPPRVLPLREGLPAGDIGKARLLGADATRLWLFGPELMGVDLASDRGDFVTLRELRQANPALADVLHAGRYDFAGQLRVLSADGRQAYLLDSATLKATPTPAAAARPTAAQWLAARHAADPTAAADWLCSGGLVTTDAWLGVHSAAEVARDFRPGSWLPRDAAVARGRDARRLYAGDVRPGDRRPVLGDWKPLGGETWFEAGFLREAPLAEAPPYRFSEPDGLLLLHRPQGWPAGTWHLTRVNVAGTPLWTADTGLGELQQVLPDPRRPAFIGLRPRVPDQLPEPLLFLPDAATGAATTHSLWQ
jgi:hypothetical protein